ncbi:unnamed protein product [Rotaria magnacalcarata]|uniref:Uncharacterized protein n=4 Tax=Rotaria magnacalcarata TaxID=392030 RepID=A0A816RP95_9BILA|nr:unnamed protein product [Rotaria magnacalcarata]
MTSLTNIPICLFCNCPSSCSLGQGDLILIRSSSDESQSIITSTPRTLEDIPNEKRNNFILETGKIIVPVDSELFNVGFQLSSDVILNGNFWVHEGCVKWSLNNEGKINDYDLIRTTITNAIKQKCTICDRYGASLSCRNESCSLKFHLSCAQSSGCFFSHSQLTFICPQHLDSVVPTFGSESSCEACSEPGDVRGQLFCTNCDKHYHAECLMLESNRVVRTGWRCPDCKICQTCRQAGDDAEMIMCNVCDKGYHTFCLRNQSIPKDGWSCSSCLSLANKNSSSSKSICSLCQNEILSKQNIRQCHQCQIRVHSTCHSMKDDYYDDDTAYLCRSCSVASITTLPMDEADDDDDDRKEIYRSSSNSKMNRLLSKSQKSNNSPTVSPSSGISIRKRRSIDYSQQSSLEYTPGGGDSNEMTAPSTTTHQQETPFIFESLSSIKDESSEHSMDLPMASAINIPIKQEYDEQPVLQQPIKSLRTQTSQKSGKGKPLFDNRSYGGEISKKRARRTLNNGHRRASSPQPSTAINPITGTNLPRTGTTTGTGCRGRPPKIRKEIPIQSTNMDEPSITPMNLLNTSGGSTGSSYTVGAVKRDDDEHHAVTVLCSSDELYTLGQDMCVSCGSFGLDEEGRLISCTQCGQSYHSYCAGLNKLSKVILKQGWRCLDCTVCEGCGKPTDESRLLLCDDCDISYHTYCLQPPLDQVPKGNWKCQWCVRCVKCGSTNPGPAGSCCLWENNYTECAPCHSLINCPACAKPYRSDELIVQCTLCDRWLHGSCEHILSEDSILSTTGDFICSLCRPTATLSSTNETIQPPPPPSSPKSSSPSDQAPLLVVATNAITLSQPQLPTPKATKLDEGVYLTDTGLAQLKSIRVKPLPKKAAAAGITTNVKSKRGGLANYYMGGVKRNNSSSIHDDDTMVNSATGGGSGTSDDEGTKKTTATVPIAKAAKGYTGIGGFHVKIRGQRRRQDASSLNNDPLQDDNLHDESSATNKRKRDRRPLKKKSVLEEYMPPDMQEAFFGSDLAEKSRLMAQNHIPIVPLQLHDQTINNNNNEYTIKLDHDTVNRFLIKKATKLALAVKEEQRQQPIVSVPTPSNALPQPVITAADDETDMQAILDNEEFCNFVEYMMNSSKTTQDPMLPLCGPTDIEDFLEFIEHPETHNELQAVDLLNNSNSTNQNVSISNENNTVQVIQSHQTTMITTTASSHHPTNSQVPLATPTSNLVVMATNVNDNSKQIINNLAREMMESTGLHTTTTSSILSQGNIQNTGLIVKQEFHDHVHQQSPLMIAQQQQQQQSWPAQQTMIRMPLLQSASVSTPVCTTPTQDRSGSAVAGEHTNLLERTREDELLGANATMSNVLYCNVNHPELKQQFPDFNERFKQMKKIWRKVPTDAKQNYTQQARLNRTKRRALKSTSSQSSTTSKGTKRKTSSKQQSSEPEDNTNDIGAGSESRSSTPSSSATNETAATVVVHSNEHQEHPTTHLYQQPRPMYSPGSGNLMVTASNNPTSFHHQPYVTQQPMQRPQQQGYNTPVSVPTGYPPPQRFNFPSQQQIPPPQQQSQNSPYFEYAPSTPRPLPHQTQSSSAESTPILHSNTVTNNNPIRKSASASSSSSSDPTTPYHHISPMDETSPYHQQQQQQSPYPNQMKQQQLLPRGMPPRPQQIMPRFPQQDANNFVRTPSSTGAPGQPARFIFASPPNQQTQQQQQTTHYVQYTQQSQGQHTVVVQPGTNESFQRMPESSAHQHIQQQHHQLSPQFSPHHHPMTPNPQQHSMVMQSQHHMSPYSSQQQQQMHHSHSQQTQHSPTIVVQPQSQFSPSSVHHHQLTLSTSGHQSPPTDPNKRPIQIQKPPQQLLVKREPMSYDEQQVKTEIHDDSLNESMNTSKTRADPLHSVPPHVLEQIDEVISDVVSGAGTIPHEIASNTHPPSTPVQIVPLTQPKIPPPHMIATHHPYVQQQQHQVHEWSNYQQQPTLNIAAMRGPPSYSHYHPQQQQHHHDLLPATTNVINTAGVPQHEQQQIVAERISSILASSPHEQQQTSVTQAPIQIKRAWPMNQQGDSHFLDLFSHSTIMTIAVNGDAVSSTDPSISLEDLLERDFKDKQQQQQQQQQQSTSTTEWSVERNTKSTVNSTTQQTPLTLAHAVHLLQQAITHPLYQQSPPPELSGLVSVGRDNDLTKFDANVNEEQFERYARWLKQRREINSLRIKADETNLADIKKKRNILLKKQKQSACTPEEEQEMPRLSQQQTEYSRTLTAMRKERKQFDELEQAFLVYKQSRLNALYPPKSSPLSTEQHPETIVRIMSMTNTPQTSIQPLQRFLSEHPSSTMTFTSTSNTDEHDDFAADDQTSLSPSITTDVQQKQTTFIQQENQSINSTLPSLHSSPSPSSSFLTLMQPLTSSNNDPSLSSMDYQQMASSPNHENETIPFEPCRTSPSVPNEDESIATSSVNSKIQSTVIDEHEQ